MSETVDPPAPEDGKHPAGGGALLLERLVFFSDAVFAIAITLLVLEIKVPHLPGNATSHDFVVALAGIAPSLFAFVLSFLVIGLFWMGHHRIFAHAHTYDSRVLWPNMLFLMAIAFMPFATAFFGANTNHFVPNLLYNLTLLGCGVLACWLAWCVARSSPSAASRVGALIRRG